MSVDRFAFLKSRVLSPEELPLAQLSIGNLQISFQCLGRRVQAVDGLSLEVPQAKTVALAGESGCGKTATALAIAGLIPRPPGHVSADYLRFRATADANDKDLARLADRELREIRGSQIAMVFQEPMSCLNPVQRVGNQIAEAVALHTSRRRSQALDRAVELISRVGIADARTVARRFPHQLSGGMCQRVMIAMALAGEPELLIADEPTTALDVTVQAMVLQLLRSIQEESGMSILLITHDLGVVAEVADDVYIMYAGRIVEHGPVEELFAKPLHPYTQALLAAMPSSAPATRRLRTIGGEVPFLDDPPRGCRFHPRCDLSSELASQRMAQSHDGNGGSRRSVLARCAGDDPDHGPGGPPLEAFGNGHYAACWETERHQS